MFYKYITHRFSKRFRHKHEKNKTILDYEEMVKKYDSYRPISPSRFHDIPYNHHPSLYTYTEMGGTTSVQNPTNVIESRVGKERIDAYLDAITSLYYRKRDVDSVGAGDEYSSSEYDIYSYPTLHLMLSPLREQHIFDYWTPKEIALFEAGLCSFGKDFYTIHKFIKTKTTNECVDFYYTWKRGSHFSIWKYFNKQVRSIQPSKLQQFQPMDERMEGYYKRTEPQ